jgi:hypothetical protein
VTRLLAAVAASGLSSPRSPPRGAGRRERLVPHAGERDLDRLGPRIARRRRGATLELTLSGSSALAKPVKLKRSFVVRR